MNKLNYFPRYVTYGSAKVAIFFELENSSFWLVNEKYLDRINRNFFGNHAIIAVQVSNIRALSNILGDEIGWRELMNREKRELCIE